ncbi:response regulator [Rhizobium redzepovicii]|uniref:response regulator n=1 Tax=Rhizobium redzepovicii TaxID=2867518 RepID=UPI002870F7DA|nr:response regulator [Rhizobium redzepovicii]MDR9781214.1 response regulator [Rhizobium redzepovicii]
MLDGHDQKHVILIVEEDGGIRAEAVTACKKSGYGTIEASNGADALEILEKRGDVSLVFTSVNMKGPIDGVQLAVRVHARWPKLAIVMTSGVVNLRQSLLPRRFRFLSKPYATEHLMTCFKLLIEFEHRQEVSSLQ